MLRRSTFAVYTFLSFLLHIWRQMVIFQQKIPECPRRRCHLFPVFSGRQNTAARWIVLDFKNLKFRRDLKYRLNAHLWKQRKSNPLVQHRHLCIEIIRRIANPEGNALNIPEVFPAVVLEEPVLIIVGRRDFY